MKQTGFSLASIMLLTAVVAIYAGGVRISTAGRQGLEPEAIALLGVAGMAVGVIVGGLVGSRYGRMTTGSLIGVCAGAAFGPPSMILVAVPRSLPVIAVGSVILLGFAVLVRTFSVHRNSR